MSTHPVSINLRRRRGLSLVELMISLAISSMLLVAVAGAYSASSNMIQVNDRFARATQAARVSMTQLLTEIRRSDFIDLGADQVHIFRPQELISPDEFMRTYRWLPGDANNPPRLVVTIKDVDDRVVTGPHTLARNVQAFSLHADTREVEDGPPIIIRVTVTLVVEIDGSTIRLSGSAVPRRAMIY
jgi:prepilin-type N-terminal cleavage/methylation domain-containing protein